MKVIPSSAFLKEFTVYAEQAVDENEVLIIQRANGKNLVLMSMDKYNEYNRELFLLKKKDEADGSEKSEK
ncbi:type II toxin-antitoxin system Phd/YefM family antitoxin [Pectinatus haikarae]|uniref:Antitoxin YefM n=1 Tax=Pectinatus haikarae TaxID=349096 RepID=A0ABT9YBM2_9FIRM|nr:type II toxin-antitoxin system Phd/YefM family antitoxin [Pectinatus haikarae]MDQ0204946.1 antitoxin YefM [Pectinatus haikarae]